MFQHYALSSYTLIRALPSAPSRGGESGRLTHINNTQTKLSNNTTNTTKEKLAAWDRMTECCVKFLYYNILYYSTVLYYILLCDTIYHDMI